MFGLLLTACIIYITPVLIIFLSEPFNYLVLFLYIPAVVFSQYKFIYSNYAETKRTNIKLLSNEILKGLRLEEEIRVNIMVIKRTWETKFRHVLVMVDSIPNLANTAEWKLIFENRQGCAGTAWDKNEQIYGDFTEMRKEGRSQWNLTSGQLNIVRDVKAVLSTPIVSKDNKFIGVLNIDTLDLNTVELLKDQELKERALEVAQALGRLNIKLLKR